MATGALRAKKMEELFGPVEDLPTLPHVVAKIGQMTVSPQTNAADIGKLISNDPALSSKILRLVNSSYYGFPRKITSVTKAIVLLGFAKVKNMAISAAVVDVMRPAGGVEGFDFVQYWRHAVATAVAAEVVARRVHPLQADDAFVSGLLAETGKSLMAWHLPEKYAEALRFARQHKVIMLEAEEEVLTCNHAEVGGYLAETWNFPETLVEVIRHAPHPDDVRRDRMMIDCVHVANAMTNALGIMGAGEALVPPLADSAWRNLKLDETVLYELENEFLRGFENAGAILDLAG
ncbi:MAG: HDOD domain-containing protein [Planctomycetes bacterium]|nr:HDOD domain-containing protein [Planctomycetota bacterium]